MTADLGFSNILKFPPKHHCGIIILRFPNEMPVAIINATVVHMIDELGAKPIPQSLIVFQPHRIRFKKSE